MWTPHHPQRAAQPSSSATCMSAALRMTNHSPVIAKPSVLLDVSWKLMQWSMLAWLHVAGADECICTHGRGMPGW